MAEITAEQAQANLLRKRENHNTPLTSVSDLKSEINTIADRAMTLNVENNDQEISPVEELRRWKFPTPEALLSVIGVGKRHIGCSFESYRGKEKVVDACNKFLAEPADVVLTGGPGTGKTHLAVAILRELVSRGNVKSEKDACFISVPELLAEIRASYREDGPDERDIINLYSRLSYLVLDDLGAEKSTEWSITTLYLIIDRRYRNMRPTVITTNLSLDRIAQTLSERIASRLSSGTVITITGQDYRTKRNTNA